MVDQNGSVSNAYPMTISGGTPAQCGNSQCDPGENCYSCPQDCLSGGQVCCSDQAYTGNCCSDSNCTPPENCTSHVCTLPPSCPDSDLDGYNSSVCGGTDCNDSNSSIRPGAAEICNNTIDDDCDSLTDCSDPDCSGNPACPAANHTCGTACSGGTPAGCTNRILADSCTPSGSCDGTNDIEDIILPSATISAGSSVQVQVQYECYQGGSGNDQVAIWYFNSTGWKLLGTWIEGQNLSGCDYANDGIDGTVSATFIVGNTKGTHYIRAVETGAPAAAGWCPPFTWGDIDDLAFNVTGYHKSDTNQDGCVSGTELSAFITLWYVDSSNPTIRELIETIGLWKRGC